MPYKIYSRICNYCGKHYIGYGQFYCSKTCHGYADRKTLENQFWSKVNITDLFSCWEWTGIKTYKGYGTLWYNNKHLSAHRVSYQLNIGKIPETLLVLHKCNNRGCVNPYHLKIGTNQDNMDDMVNANRQAHNFGEKSGSVKLTEKLVKEIIELLNSNISERKLARKFSVSKSCIGAIKRKITWKHIPR